MALMKFFFLVMVESQVFHQGMKDLDSFESNDISDLGKKATISLWQRNEFFLVKKGKWERASELERERNLASYIERQSESGFEIEID